MDRFTKEQQKLSLQGAGYQNGNTPPPSSPSESDDEYILLDDIRRLSPVSLSTTLQQERTSTITIRIRGPKNMPEQTFISTSPQTPSALNANIGIRCSIRKTSTSQRTNRQKSLETVSVNTRPSRSQIRIAFGRGETATESRPNTQQARFGLRGIKTQSTPSPLK